ncbi:unnamed protein product [Mortierella alpina]
MNLRVALLGLFFVALSPPQDVLAAGPSSEGSANVALRDTQSTQDYSVLALQGALTLQLDTGRSEEKPLIKRPLYSSSHFNDRMGAAAEEETEAAEERWRQEILEAQRLRIQSQLERSRGRW